MTYRDLFRPPLILNYHGVDRIEPRFDPLRLYVTPEKLESQIKTLQRRGYEFLSMTDFGRLLRAGGSLHGLCALTFDDGTEDHATVVPEVLAATGVPGTIYICSGLLGEPYPWVDSSVGVRFMTEAQLKEIARHPLVELGAHTLKHTKLVDADAEMARRELADSKAALEDQIGAEVTSFCYPACDYSEPCPRVAAEVGFQTAVTCRHQGGWEAMELRRESIQTPDGSLTFAFKSRGLYYTSRDLAPFRFLRWATRSFRHRAERGSGEG